MTVKVYHTQAGIIVGYDSGTEMVGQQICHVVENPVMLTITENNVSMMPFFTITKTGRYLLPRDTLTFAKPMEPNEKLEESYLKAYGPQRQDDDGGMELTTAPTVLEG